MVRGSGKFKTKRGGGRNFSRNLEPLDGDFAKATPNKWSARDEDDSDADSDEEEDSDESSDDGTGVLPQPGPLAGGSTVPEPEVTRAERRAQKKAGKPAKPIAKANAIAEGEEEEEDDDDDPALVNPNRAASKSTKLSAVGAEPVQLSRREREAQEAKEAKDRYWKLHQAGKTDQAKADLARLAAIRKEREQAAAQRKAEQAAREAELASKQAASKQKR
ncbi:hypothetical protein CALCODRAFT_486546 [Calocera cornea HHB12733]|uniref:Casein kinase substrate phosphoprotein PP28 domain-containing protein n=1 Tax=Calocera cornea HHB12733 TaxID=1353952 RepID=A0A165DNE0_9BASI|nr:hypothetical protein CALCODRAFT_486546 [Calocera cornea HHB12733]